MKCSLAMSAVSLALLLACANDHTAQEPTCGPVPTAECSNACDVACAALEACSQATSTCRTDCRYAMRCAGENQAHDRAICKGLVDRISGASCTVVCREARGYNINPNSCGNPMNDAGR